MERERYTDNRPCLAVDTASYERVLTEACTISSSFVRAKLREVRRIYIEQEFLSAAWSSQSVDGSGGLIGLRKKELDAALTLQDFVSWFEQQTFGNDGEPHVDPTLPCAVIEPRNVAQLPVLLTLLHEVGHLFDYTEHFNRARSDPDFASSWTALSWLDLDTIDSAADFPDRQHICLNACGNKPLPSARARALHTDLVGHGFVSQLAAIGPMEDFADTKGSQ